MGGTLTWVSGVHRLLSTSLFGGSGTAAGDMPGTCTLLGPEGPGTARSGEGYGSSSSWRSGFSDFRAERAMREAGSADRTLRTTQWTRAS